MEYNFVQKKREEDALIVKIASSGLISEDILNDIRRYYNRLPYHNFLHVLKICYYVTILPSSSFDLVEIKSLMYSALFHDCFHDWKPDITDEPISYIFWCMKIKEYQEKYDIWYIDFSIVRNAIIWTVFSNRWNFDNKYSIIMSDLDIWIIWEWVYEYCYYWWLSLSSEFWINIDDWVQDYTFFKVNLNISDKFFLSKEVQDLLPNCYTSIYRFITMEKSTKVKMYEILKNEDITFLEFKEKFKN